MKRHTFPVATVLLILLVAAICFAALPNLSSTQAASEAASQQQMRNVVETRAPDSCPVTKPPAHAFVPPSPYPTEVMFGSFWYGTRKLWTSLVAEGTWKGLPHYRPTDTAFRNKLFWFREGYDWRRDQEPALRVIGVRLDSSDPPVVLTEHANAGWTSDKNHAFIVDAVDLPSLGCWKLTGRYKDGKLSFVVWVTQ